VKIIIYNYVIDFMIYVISFSYKLASIGTVGPPGRYGCGRLDVNVDLILSSRCHRTVVFAESIICCLAVGRMMLSETVAGRLSAAQRPAGLARMETLSAISLLNHRFFLCFKIADIFSAIASANILWPKSEKCQRSAKVVSCSPLKLLEQSK